MKVTFDPDADAMYIEFKPRKGMVADTKEINWDTLIDVDSNGHVLGIELLDVSKRMSKKDIEKLNPKILTNKITP